MEKKICKYKYVSIYFTLVIADLILSRRRALEQLEQHYVENYNALGTRMNHRTHKKWYREFCKFSHTKPFPVTEFKITKFATYLSDIMKTVQSIQAYCTTVCDENELRGYRPVQKGLKYHRAIAGIRKKLQHQVRRAKPMTEEMLEKIEPLVDLNNQKETVIWVAMLGGFFMVLRKSNLVPLKRVHDYVHNIVRSDVRYANGVMVVLVRWSKTDQCGEKLQETILVTNNHSAICPVR